MDVFFLVASLCVSVEVVGLSEPFGRRFASIWDVLKQFAVIFVHLGRDEVATHSHRDQNT